jgi:hypothetical protein
MNQTVVNPYAILAIVVLLVFGFCGSAYLGWRFAEFVNRIYLKFKKTKIEFKHDDDIKFDKQ